MRWHDSSSLWRISGRQRGGLRQRAARSRRNGIVYVALGASDAAGVGAEPITRGYVFRIADELDERVDEVFLANLGVPGANTEQLDQALELFLQSEVEPDLRHRLDRGQRRDPGRGTPTTSRTRSRTSSSACARGPTA